MCGITGIIGSNFDHQHLDTMMRRIAHRGPDSQGRWSNGTVSLGHLRLKIIDLSERAAQPMICPLTGNVLTFNGEIYNYREIKSELAGHYPFQTDSDTEVILAAYSRWGTAALQQMRGMFAFALYDAEQQKTLLARDRFGIKPFYYLSKTGVFLFSSEIKGLLGFPGSPSAVNLKKVFGFLAHRHLDTDSETFFKDINQLPVAHFAWVNNRGEMLAPVEYWSPPHLGEQHFESKDKILFREKLAESVRLHLRSDVPVASFLSGGLDSSSIACLASQELSEGYKLQTFSSVLEEKTEENELIDVMQKHLKDGVHHSVVFDGNNFLEELPRVTYHHDEPLADASMYAHWELCKLARQQGVKVLLSGNGGDEVLGGYASYIYALLGRLLKKGNWYLLACYLYIFSESRPESVTQLILRAVQEATPFSHRERHKQSQGLLASQLLNGAFSAKNYEFYPHRSHDPYVANLLNNLRHWTVPPFLHYEDRNSMAFGVEIRVPMLDHIFFEFVTAYRPEDLLKGRSKQALRESMRGVVPDLVLDQRLKYGFAAPLEKFLAYEPAATHRFFREQVERVPFLNQKLAGELAKEVLAKQNQNRFQYFWRVLSVAVWYNTFFSGAQEIQIQTTGNFHPVAV